MSSGSFQNSIGGGDLLELFAQQFAASAQSRHDCSDGNAQYLRGFFVGELFDIHQQNDRLVVLGDLVERRQDLFIAQFLGNRFGRGQAGFKKLFRFFKNRKTEPLAAVVLDAVKEDPEQPAGRLPERRPRRGRDRR